MGRKGQCGGTAGGGRSGRKGRLVYNRVIPNFLQRLAGPQYTANPIDAKRHGMNSEPDVAHEQRATRRERQKESEENVGDDWKGDVEGEIRRLQAEGFNVVDASVGERSERLESTKKNPDAHVLENRGESGKRLGVRGGIEKKRTSTVILTNAFGVKNRQKLSFVESESDSGSD